MDTPDGQGLDQAVEDPPDQPSVEPRIDPDTGIVDRARPDRHVRTLAEGGLEPLDFR